MNNNFSKFFMALVCLLSVSFAAQAQAIDSTVYKVVFFTSGEASDGARVLVQFNEGNTTELDIQFNGSSPNADTLNICIGSDCGSTIPGEYLVGPSGSLIDVAYAQGQGSTETTRGIAVLTPFSTSVLDVDGDKGLFNARINDDDELELAGGFITLSQSNSKRFKLIALNDCGYWGMSDGDFAPNEINPILDNQVIQGPLAADCQVDVAGACLRLPLPKVCAADADQFPYTFTLNNPFMTDLEDLVFTIYPDSVGFDYTSAQELVLEEPIRDPSGRFFTVCIDNTPGWYHVPVGIQTVDGLYEGSDGESSTMSNLIYFDGPGSTSIVTNDEVEFSLDVNSNCEYAAQLDDFLEGDIACEGADSLYTIEIFDRFGRNLGDTLDADEIAGTDTGYPLQGEALTVHVVYIPTGTLGWVKLKLKDAQPPVLEGIDGEIECTHPLVAQLIDGSAEDFVDVTEVFDELEETVPADGSITFELELTPDCVFDNDFVRSIEVSADNDDLEFEFAGTAVDSGKFVDGSFTTTVTISNDTDEDIDISEITAVFRQTYKFNDERRVMLNLDDLSDCSPLSVELQSTSVKYNCPDESNIWVGATITRTWIGTDATGNTDTYVQHIDIIAPTFDAIEMPRADVELGCEFGEEGADLSPENLFSEGFEDAAPRLGCGILEREANKNLCSIVWTFEDQELPGCGPNGKKILRRWTILNWCTKQTFPEFTQAIKVQDNEGPEITDIDLHFGSEPYDCEGEIRIDLDLTDDCSGVSTVVVDYSSVGGIDGPVNGSIQAEDGELITIGNLPLGVNVDFDITITDACGNSTLLDTFATAQDVSAPICKVDDQHNVVVGSDGRGFVRAADVDEGSEDNCGLRAVEVRREGGEWGPFAEYTCSDIVNGLLTIEFRAVDYSGNECTTWMEILVEDGIAPTVLAPRNMTVSCDDPEVLNARQFLLDRNGDGDVTAEDFFADNCVGANIIDIEYEEDIDECGDGYAEVTVTGRDNSAKTQEVVYTDRLTIEGVRDYQVTFPADRVVEGCGSDVLAEMPVLINDGCSKVLVNMKADTLKAVNGGCYKIHKVFTVIDLCAYEPGADEDDNDVVIGDADDRTFMDAGDGIVRYTQVIEVTDNVDPTVAIDASTLYCINDEDCDTDITFTVRAADDCAISQRVSYRVYSADEDASGAATIVANNTTVTLEDFEEGDYVIEAHTSDNCGNTATARVEFEVRDCKRPTPVCFQQLNAPLMVIGEQGMVDIWASDFISYATDNCTDEEYLIDNAVFEWGSTPMAGTQIIEDLRGRANAGLRVNRSAFGANDCNLDVQIRIRVTDRAGNSNYCTTTFLVQDNEKEGCPSTNGSGSIAGSISTFEGDMVEDATVSVEGANAIPTSVNGTFNFANLEAGSSYTVTAAKEDGLTNGVNTQDILIIVRHLLSEKELDNPYNFIAADVNRDGKVSPVDLVNIRKAILRDITEFPGNDSWRFVDKAYQFDASNPLEQDFKEAVEIKSLDADSRANFYGVKIGDVNGSAIVNSSQTDSRSAKQLVLGVDDIELKAGEVYTVAVKATDAATLSGYQFTMNFADGVEFQGAASSSIDLDESNFGYGSMDLGMITTAWDNVNGVSLDANDELFNVTLKANVDARLSEVFGVDSRLTPAAGFIGTENVEIANVELAYNNATAETVLFQNTPNPFANETVISFNLGNAGEATVTVYDMAGKVVTSIEGDYAAGINNVVLNRAQLNASGVLYYQLETANFSATKKMVVLK